MASTVSKSLRDGVLTIKDGTATPQTVDIILGTGNITWDVSTPNDYENDRGIVATGQVRKAEEVALSVNITARFIDILSDTGEEITPYEAVYGLGAAATATWVTTGADNCEPYAVDLSLVFTPACSGGTAKTAETIVLPEFRADSCAFDPTAGTIVIVGKCKVVHPTVTRA